MSDQRQAMLMALEALEQQHRDRTAYSIAKQAANATCAEFKNNTLSELIDSGYRCSEMGKRTVSAIDALRAALAAVQASQQATWVRAVDEAMVTHHIGTAEPSDDYETAVRKLNSLLCHAQSIGEYFAKQAAQPLTDEQIAKAAGWDRLSPTELAFARAIERAHGIGGPNAS